MNLNENPAKETIAPDAFDEAFDKDAEYCDLSKQFDQARAGGDKDAEIRILYKKLACAKRICRSDLNVPPIYYFGLGLTLYEMLRFDEAEVILRQGLASYDHYGYDPFMLCGLVEIYAQVLEKLGRSSDAEEILSRPDYLQEQSTGWG
jgi:tetratricopeptide (TPR) repeat protein